ncbi:MAG: hypothetical protein VW518_08465, partial [Burkholderiaceae bacterium]
MTSHRYSRTAWLAALLLLALSGCQTMVQAPSPVRAVGSPTASPAITRDTTTGQPAAPAGELKDLVSAQPVSVEVAEAPSSVAEEAVPDLWDRIRNGLSMPALESKLVRTHEV